MNRSFFLSTVFISVWMLTACYHPEPEEAMRDLYVLAGNWSSQQIQFFETWEVMSDTLMEGMGYSLQEKDKAFKEMMKFYYEDKNVFLAVKQGLEEDYTLFKLTEAERNKWVFENKTNEYPNIITYEISGDDLLASIMNSKGHKKIEFKLKRR